MTGIMQMLLSSVAAADVYELYAWGDNDDSELGIGSTSSRSSPVQVGSLVDWKDISIRNNFAIANKTDYTLWSWGNNYNGQLGLNDRTTRNSPVQVGALTNWQSISAGGDWTHAIKTDNTLWAWGGTFAGRNGLNISDNSRVSSPVQVAGGAIWAKVSAGVINHSFGITIFGTLWAWGANNGGKLGLNDAFPGNQGRSTPTQVGGLTNWKEVATGRSHALAVKTDGTLWGWGYNNLGQLGQNHISPAFFSSPIQIGALTNWSKISAGAQLSFGVKTDGTLWAWGSNILGRLGTNSTIDISSPTQVGALANWTDINVGYGYNVAGINAGRFFTWGQNEKGELGQNDTVDRSSPVQVGTLTTWYRAQAGSRNTMGLKTPE